MSDKTRLRRIITRTRKGCLTCRNRRKRCDEVRPACTACIRLSLKCVYGAPLKWANDRTSFVESDQRSVSRTCGAGFDFASLAVDSTTHVQLRQVLGRIGVSQELERTIFGRLCDKDREILFAFLTSGYRTLITNLNVDADFLAFFTECGQSFASLWSCITYQVSMDSAYTDLFHHYYHRCLVLFREELAGIKTIRSDEPIWFVGMFLCCISANQLLPWSMHVNAMITYLQSEGDLNNIDLEESGLHELVLGLASFDLSAYILNRKTKCHKLWVKYGLGLPGIVEELGMPCSLVDLLAQLDKPHAIDALFDWQAPSGELVQMYSWEATRLAAIVRALEDSKTKFDLDIATTLLSKGISLRYLAKSILEQVRLCLLNLAPEFGHFKQVLVFPLVMAASQRNHLDIASKDFICATLKDSGIEGNYNVRQGVLNVVQVHWGNDADTIEETARRLDIELALW